ncbi:MAG TPA: hypothetical protein VJ964_06265, partial [Balneolaceae bacterium]|nr:hypothetical protein [Balneolaceae bacterium]
MPNYADIVFPTAVRYPFTYALPDQLLAEAEPGKRVWVPLQKHKAIGMIVKIHRQKPDFNTRSIEKILDEEPVLSDELLKLSKWMYRFYYCGWGEVIQAALPVGLNFYSENFLKALETELPDHLKEAEEEIVKEIRKEGSYLLKEAQKRWGDKVIKKLVGQKLLEVWEEPAVKMDPHTENLWRWTDKADPNEIQELIKDHKERDKFYKWVQALELLANLELPEFQNELTQYDLLEHYTLQR